MYKLICCNLSKSNRSLTNFTSTYRQVAQNYEKRHAKKKQFVSETDLQSVEENAETPDAKAETIEEESSVETKTKSCPSFFTKNLGLRELNYHLAGMEKYSQNVKFATSTSSTYSYSSMSNQGQHTTPKKKPFKNKEAMDMYEYALEQCMKIKVKKASFDKLYRKVKLAPQLIRAASWEDERKTEEPQEAIQEPEEKKKTKKFVYVYPEERLKHLKKETPPPSMRCRPHIMNELDYQLTRRKVKITYPTHLVKYKLGINKSSKILKTKKKDEDEGSLFVREKEIMKSEYPVIQPGNVKFAKNSPQHRQEEETEEEEWQDVAVKHPKIEKIEKIPNMRINARQSKLLFRPRDYKDLLREGDEVTVKEDATKKLAMSRTSKVATDEAEQTWAQPKIMVHPAVASKPLNTAEKYPKRYFVDRNDNYDIENICMKNNENSTTNTKYGDYIVEFVRGARMAEKETKIMRKLKVILPDMEIKPQKSMKEVSVAPKEVVEVNITEGKVKEMSLKQKGPAESLADYLKKLKELKEQTAVNRLNIRKPVVSEMVKKYEPPSIKNPITKLGGEENAKIEDKAVESKLNPPEEECRLPEKPPQQNVELANTETCTNVEKQNDEYKPGEVSLEKLVTGPSIEAPKKVTKPLESVDTETSKLLVQTKKKLPTRPIYSSIPVAKNKQLLKKIKSEIKSDTPQLEIAVGAVKTNEIVAENKLNANKDDGLAQDAAEKKSMQNLKKIMNRYEVQQTKLQTEPGTVRREIKLDDAAIKRINKRRRKNKLQQEKKEKEKAKAIKEEAANTNDEEHEFGGKESGGREEQNKAKKEEEESRIRMIVEQSVQKQKENEIRLGNEKVLDLSASPGETKKKHEFKIGKELSASPGETKQKHEFKIGKEEKKEQEQQSRNIINSPVSSGPEKKSHTFKLDRKDVLEIESASAPINLLSGEKTQQQKDKTDPLSPPTSVQDKRPQEGQDKKLQEGSISINKILSALSEDRIENVVAQQLDQQVIKAEEKPDLLSTKTDQTGKVQPSQIFNITSTTRSKGKEQPTKHKYELAKYEANQNASQVKLLDKPSEGTEVNKKQPNEIIELEQPSIDNKLKESLTSILPVADETVKEKQRLDQRDGELAATKEENMEEDQTGMVLEKLSTEKIEENLSVAKELESHITQEILAKTAEATQESKKEDTVQQSKTETDKRADTGENKDKELQALQLVEPLVEAIKSEEKLRFKRIEYVEKEYKLEEDSSIEKPTVKMEQKEEDKREIYKQLKEAGWHITIPSEGEPGHDLDKRQGTNRPAIRRENPKETTKGKKKKKKPKSKKDMVLPSKGQNDPRIRNSSLDKPTKEFKSLTETTNDKIISNSEAVSLDGLKRGKSLTGLVEEQKEIMLNEINEKLSDAHAQKDTKLNTAKDPVETTINRRYELKAISSNKKKQVGTSNVVQTAAKPPRGDKPTQEQQGTVKELTSKEKRSVEKDVKKTASNSKDKQSVRDEKPNSSLFAKIKDHNKRSAKEEKYVDIYASKDKNSPKSKSYLTSTAEEVYHSMNEKKTDEISISEGKRFPNINKRKYAKEYGENTNNLKSAKKVPKEKDKKSLIVAVKRTPLTISKLISETKKSPRFTENALKSKTFQLSKEADEIKAEVSEVPIKSETIGFSDNVFSKLKQGKIDNDVNQNEYTVKDNAVQATSISGKIDNLSSKIRSWIDENVEAKQNTEDKQDYPEYALAINNEVEPSAKEENEIKARESKAALVKKDDGVMKFDAKVNKGNKNYIEKDGGNNKTFKSAKKVPKEKDKKLLIVTVKLNPFAITKPISETHSADPIEQITRSTEKALEPKRIQLSKRADEIKGEESEAPIKTKSIEFSDNVFAKIKRGKIDDDIKQKENKVNDNAEQPISLGGGIEKLSSKILSWLDNKVEGKPKADDEQDHTEHASPINDEIEPSPKEENEIKATESGAALVKSKSIEFSDNVFSKVRRGRIGDDDLVKDEAKVSKENEKDYTEKDTEQSSLINDDIDEINIWQVKAKAKEEEMDQMDAIERGGTVQSQMDQNQKLKDQKRSTVETMPLGEVTKPRLWQDKEVETNYQKKGVEKSNILQAAEKSGDKPMLRLDENQKSADKTTPLGEVAKSRLWQDNTVETKYQKKAVEKSSIVQAAEKSDEIPVLRTRSTQGFKVQQTKDGKTIVVFPYLKKKLVKPSIIADRATTQKPENIIADKQKPENIVADKQQKPENIVADKQQKAQKNVADHKNRLKSPMKPSAMGKYRAKSTPSDAENVDSRKLKNALPKKKLATKIELFSQDNEAGNELKRSTSEDLKTMRKKLSTKHSPSPTKKGPADVKSEKETKPDVKKAASSNEFSFNNAQETKTQQFPGLVPNMRRNSPDSKTKHEKIPIGFVRVIDEDEKEMAKSVLSVQPKTEKSLMTTLDNAKRLQEKKGQANIDDNLECCRDLLKKNTAIVSSKSLPQLNEIKWDEEKYAQAINLLLPITPDITAMKEVQEQEKTDKKSKGGQELIRTSKPAPMIKKTLDLSKRIDAREDNKEPPVLAIPTKKKTLEKKRELIRPVKRAQQTEKAVSKIGDIDRPLNSIATTPDAALLEISIATDAKIEKPKTDEIMTKKRKNAQQLEKVIIKIDSTPVTAPTTQAETPAETNTSYAVASKSLPELTKEMKDNSKEQPGKKIKVIVRETKDPKVLTSNSYVSKLKDISPSSKCSLERSSTIRSAIFNIKGMDASTKYMYTSRPPKNPDVKLKPTLTHLSSTLTPGVSTIEKLKKLTKPIKEVISDKPTSFGRVEELRIADNKLETLYVNSKKNMEHNQINIKGTIKKSGEPSGENLKTLMLNVNTVDNAKSAQKIRKSERLDAASMGKILNTATKSSEHRGSNKTDKNVCKSIWSTTKSISRPLISRVKPPDENELVKLSTDRYRLKKERSQFPDNLSKIDTKSLNIFVTKPKKKERTRKYSGIPDIYFDTEISKELKKIDAENMRSRNVTSTKHKNNSHQKRQKNDSRKAKYALENYTNHSSTFYTTSGTTKRITNTENKKRSAPDIKITNKRHTKQVKGKFSVTSSPYLVQSDKNPKQIENEYPEEVQKDHKKYSLEVIMERKEKIDENSADPKESKYAIATPSKNKTENILLTYFHKYLVDNQLEAEFSKYLQEMKYFAKAKVLSSNSLPNVLSREEENAKHVLPNDDSKNPVTNENVEPQIKEVDINIMNNKAKCTSLVKFEEPSRSITPMQSLDTSPLPEDFSSNQTAQIKEILKENYKEEKICKFNKNLLKHIKPDLDKLAKTQEGAPQLSEMKHLMKFWTPDLTNTKKEITNRAELNNATTNLKEREERKAKLLTKKETKEISCSKINSAPNNLKEQQERKKLELLTRKERKKISYNDSIELNVESKNASQPKEPKKAKISHSKELKSANTEKEPRKAESLTGKEPKEISRSNLSKVNRPNKTGKEQEEKKDELLTRKERKRKSYSKSEDVKSERTVLIKEVEPRNTEHSASKRLKSASKCLTEREKPRKVELITGKETNATKSCKELGEKRDELLTRNERTRKSYSNSNDLNSGNKCLTDQVDKRITEQEEPRKEEQEEGGAELLLTRNERKKIYYSNSDLIHANTCLMEQVEARKIECSDSKELNSIDKCLTEQEELRKAKLIIEKEITETSHSNSGKLNSTTEVCKEQEEREVELLLTRNERKKMSYSNSVLINVNRCLMEQEEARKTECSDSKELKSADKCLTEQEKPRKAKLITEKETKETPHSNSGKLNGASNDCKVEEERGAELLLTRNERKKVSYSNSVLINENKCLMEEEEEKKTECSISKELKNTNKCLTNQEEPRKAKLISEKQITETPHSNSGKLNSATENCTKQEERGAELLLTRNEKKKISYSNSKELNSIDKCLTEQKKPREADPLIVEEKVSGGNPNKSNTASKNCKEQAERKVGLLTRRKISYSNSDLNSPTKCLTKQEKSRKTDSSNSEDLKSADKHLTEQTDLRKAKSLTEKETMDLSCKLRSATKISKEQDERNTELLTTERKKISNRNSTDLNSGHKCLTQEEKPRKVESLTKKETEEISSTKSEVNRKEAIKTKSLATKQGKNMSNTESSIRISSITIEKTIPDRHQVVNETPKRVAWGCNKICLPLKNLSFEALKQPIDSATTLNMPISDNHRHISNNVPDNLAKYKHMKITHMVVKRRPSRTLDEHFLPLVRKGRKRKDSRQQLKDLNSEEEKAAMITLRYELLRKLHKQFCSLYGEDAEKIKGNFEKVPKHYDKAIENNDNEPEALPKARPKVRTVDWYKLDLKSNKMDIRKEIEKEKEACNVNFSLHPSKELRNRTELFIEKLALQEISSNKKDKDKTDLDETGNKDKPNKKEK